jgi:F420-non-reducing hydrogenase large subunit
VTIPRAAWLLRNALNYGQFIHSHGVHFFALAGPDLILGLDADPAKRNILGLVEAAPDVATKALRLRTIGQRVSELIGGRGTHPVSCVAGGIGAPLGKEKRETLRKLADEAVTLGTELFSFSKKLLLSKMDLVQSLPLETHYLGTVRAGALDLYDGDLRLVSPDGQHKIEFKEEDWMSHLFEETVPGSYAKYVFCKTGADDAVPYRVGPLARLNCCDRIDTPLANAELEELRKVAGNPCHQTVVYHYARLIEILHAAERLHAIMNDDEVLSENVRAPTDGTPRNATAHIEAPRGTLIHDYQVDGNGIVTEANLIVATQQNMSSINATVGMSAQQYLDQPDGMLLNAIEFGVRCYDPCLSCATHRIGEMKLDLSIRKDGSEVRRVRR